MKTIALILITYSLLIGNCLAGEISYPTAENPLGEKVIFDDKYSQKDFTGKTLLEAKDLEGIVIFGSCFSQETPDTKVFPESVKNLTFYNCNLSNVLIQPGWITIGCQETRYKVQIDGKDWEIDANNMPVRKLNEE